MGTTVVGELYFVLVVSRYREIFNDAELKERTEKMLTEQLKSVELEPVHAECSGFLTLVGVKLSLTKSTNEIAYAIRKIVKQALTECGLKSIQHPFYKHYYVATHCPNGTELLNYVTKRMEEDLSIQKDE